MSHSEPNTGSSMPLEHPSTESANDLDAKLQEEIEAALGDMNLEDMIDDDQSSSTHRAAESAMQSAGGAAPARRTSGGSALRRGMQRAAAQPQTRVGTITGVHGGDVMVEFGPKMQGMCPLAQFETPPALGEKVEFILQRFDKDDGLYILSRKGQTVKAEWESLEVGQNVEARCVGVNKGGLDMEVANHRAFMPAGHVDIKHIAQLEVFIGEKMPCEVIELDRNKGRIILSRKSILSAEREHLKEKLLAELEVGQSRPAVITRVQPYGAFADLGGIDGLIHISDLSYERLKDPSEVVKEGDNVEVRVLKIDRDAEPVRIGLGLKQLQEDPRKAAFKELKEGETVSGKVTKLAAFGAFVELAPGLEGLIHISELSHDRVSRPSQVVKPDEIVNVKVLSIDNQSKRIGLSLKALQDQPAPRPKKGERRRKDEPAAAPLRDDDAHMRKLRAQLSAKFGDNLKGGIG